MTAFDSSIQKILRRIHYIMKRIIALFLCAAAMLGVFAGCSTLEKDDKGAIIDVYLTTDVYNFDPALGFNDDAMVKLYGLIYEGLTRINEKGKMEYALMKEYKIIEDEEDEDYRMQITLNSTKWSDGRAVQANDIVYAWKRILDPDFQNEAAAMLYDIKNARAVKTGDATIDDLGLTSIDTYVLEITFEKKINYEEFLVTLASPALVPLREDIVVKNADWAKKSSTIVTNGPFAIKGMEYGNAMRLERCSYFYLDSEKEEALDKYVIPYRLIMNLKDSEDIQLENLLNGDIFYLGEIPLSARAEYKDAATITDMMNAHTYYFNTNNKLFADAKVRTALSVALDRQAIADIVVYATPATGMITNKVLDTNGEFRANGGELIAKTGDTAKAKSLLSEAGVTSGSFTITIRPNEVDRAIADYVVGVWGGLGFNVTIKEVSASVNPLDTTIYIDDFTNAYRTGDFDVIAIDWQMLSTDAYSTLAPFATGFSGNGVDMTNENYDLIPHVTGYSSEEYDALIEEIYNETDLAVRSEKLHKAEEMLVADMPVAPLVFLQDAYLYSSELSGIKTNYYGVRIFNRMKQKDYMTYKLETSFDTNEDTTAAE